MSDPARVTHVIGGKAWEQPAGRRGQVFESATGALVADVDFAGRREVDVAVTAARQAFGEWGRSSIAARTRVLFAFRELLAEGATELARIIAAEHGKVVDDAAGEVARGLEVTEFACGIAQLLKGGFSSQVSRGVDVHSVRQPLGVVAGITPFNFPVMVPLWMVPIAIACGNTFVLKPSEKDPSASVVLAELWREAGLPDGVFNVVQGDAEAVDAILDHPGIRAVSFVGSTPVARHVFDAATRAGKRVQALGGAKNHMVVLPDADLDAAADAAVSAGFGSAGERCMAISVVVAVEPVGDDLVDRIRARAGDVVVGPSLDPSSEMGPLVTAEHRDRVAAYLDAGPSQGATLVSDGRLHPHEGEAGGYWLGPSILDRVTPHMEVYRDEIFGPVLCVVRVPTTESAIALVNTNPYGNGTAVFTADGGAARRFEEEIEVGMVGVNVPIPVPAALYPFGGWKDSLFGDLHIYGEDGVRFYTRNKVVTSRWPDPSQRGVDLGFPRSH
jgi:malonate-semialdehyde dehydrogenase (acetylating) / methylmalonate-semialdehyde dehydrogenase